MSDESAGRPVALTCYSEVESRRFGYRIHRATLADVDDKALLAELLRENVDIAMLRFPSAKQPDVARLSRTGMPYVVADTLVCYAVDLAGYEPRPLRNRDLEFVRCRPEHVEELGVLVDEVFEGYANHYCANPYLARRDIRAAFVDWARRYVAAEDEGRTCWLARRGGQAVAFATCSFNEPECEGVLYGVRASAAGGGIYGDLIRHTQRDFKSRGFTRMQVSTQTQNLAVQVVWNREGFRLSDSCVTVHVNSMLEHSAAGKHLQEIVISPDDIERCGKYSGDMNPLHFDDAFARGAGFEGRIAHGLILGSTISRFYGTEFPGPGTVFVSYSYKFLRPVYPGKRYRLDFSFPMVDAARGFYKSLARLTDEAGRTCLLSYNDLYRRPG